MFDVPPQRSSVVRFAASELPLYVVRWNTTIDLLLLDFHPG